MKMKQKIKVIFLLTVCMIMSSSMIVYAQTLPVDTTNEISQIMVSQLVKEHQIDIDNVLDIETIEINSIANTYNQISKAQKFEAIKVTSVDEENIVETIVVPFILEEDKLVNVTRSSLNKKDLKYDEIIYFLAEAEYYYYTAGETNYNGPFYRPTLLKAKWANGTQVCSVKSLDASFVSKGYVCNLMSGTHDGTIYTKRSDVYVTNPAAGITYVGNNITMSDQTGLSMYFNGIDTFSYIMAEIIFSHGGKTETYDLSIPTFANSGYYEE